MGGILRPYLKEGVADYARRLRRYTTLTMTEVAKIRVSPGAGTAEVEAVKTKEADRILARLSPSSYTVALDERGRVFDSLEMARWLDGLATQGLGRLTFVIGGADGLAPVVLSRADLTFSLSRLTFPHEIACLLLLEQLYRAFRINRGQPYHH